MGRLRYAQVGYSYCYVPPARGPCSLVTLAEMGEFGQAVVFASIVQDDDQRHTLVGGVGFFFFRFFVTRARWVFGRG